MTTQPIPFGMQQESGESEMAGASPQVINLVMDSKGAMRRRPGIKAYSGAPATSIDSYGVSGLYAASGGDLFAVGNHPTRKAVYRVKASGAVSLSNPGGELVGTGRPVFAETEALLVMAAGARMKKVVLASFAMSDLGGGPPAASSHVIANNNRLLANDLGPFKNQVFFSDQSAGSSYTGNEAWTSGTAGFFSADARPDPVVALSENSNEVFCHGSTNVQIVVPDPELVYANNVTREYGCIAPYSVVKFDGGFGWLDHFKRIVAGDGRSLSTISKPIQNNLDDMSVVDDCHSYRVQLGISDVLVWSFLSEGRTFVYSADHGWSQWSGWDSAADNWDSFKVLSYCQRPDIDACLVGMKNGVIGQLDADTSTDLGDKIVCSSTTGFLDRGTSKLKLSTAIRLTFRPVMATSSAAPLAWLSWRDDLGPFCNPLPVDLTQSPVVQFTGLGTYRHRQWKLLFSGTDSFELASVEEDFAVQGV